MSIETADDFAGNGNNMKNWSDLPQDILGLVKTWLFAADKDTFNAVCKSWRASPHITRILPSLTDAQHPSAYLMFFEPHNNRVKLFHPIYNDFYSRELSGLSDAKIKCCRYGWLLVSRPDFSLFFFNPISGTKIQLPDIPRDDYWSFGYGTMCFTDAPTSDTCLILGICNHWDAAIGVLRRGQSNWDIKVYDSTEITKDGKEDLRLFSESSPILHKGLYYALGSRGRVGVYDPKDKTWNILGKDFKSRSHHVCDNFLLELDGDLVAVFVLDCNDKRSVRLCKLDLEKMVWRDMQSLGDKMIYVSKSLSFAETATTNGMANKIYFPKICANTGVFYSMKTKKFCSFSGKVSSLMACQQGYIPSSTWIVPTSDGAGEKELTW